MVQHHAKQVYLCGENDQDIILHNNYVNQQHQHSDFEFVPQSFPPSTDFIEPNNNYIPQQQQIFAKHQKSNYYNPNDTTNEINDATTINDTNNNSYTKEFMGVSSLIMPSAISAIPQLNESIQQQQQQQQQIHQYQRQSNYAPTYNLNTNNNSNCTMPNNKYLMRQSSSLGNLPASTTSGYLTNRNNLFHQSSGIPIGVCSYCPATLPLLKKHRRRKVRC